MFNGCIWFDEIKDMHCMPEEINAETDVKSGFLKDCISHETPDCIHRLGSLNVPTQPRLELAHESLCGWNNFNSGDSNDQSLRQDRQDS